jgi:HEAT repeat protein
MEAALVLRLKARIGDTEPSVVGHVLDALVEIEGERALPLLEAALRKGECATREEAALALGSSRLPRACELLQGAHAAARDLQFRDTLLRALSLTRQESAIRFLLGIVGTGRRADALGALNALALHRGSEEIRRAVASAVQGREPDLGAEYRKLFES